MEMTPANDQSLYSIGLCSRHICELTKEPDPKHLFIV